MSTINTNGIDVNYPVPGVNNSSQGFRNNFTNIKTNLDTAGNEITDLQNKAVLKAALANTVLDNNMANTLISNASTRNFRATTYNLGNALSGTVLVDVSLADVQYGNIASNVTFEFGGWTPAETQRTIELQLGISNAEAVITFPSEVIASSDDYGVTLLENYANIANVPTITAPANCSQINLSLSSTDCGNSIVISPINRPYQSTQIQTRTPPPTGIEGDTSGAVCVDPPLSQLTVTNTTTSTNVITTSGNTTQLYTDLPVIFTGTTFGGITAGTTYYIRNVVTSNTFTVSSAVGGANASLSTASGTMYANPLTYLYIASDDFNSTVYGKTVSNTTVTTNNITLNNTTSLVVNAPIIFEGNVFGGLEANVVYYIKTISSPNVTVSKTRYNGIAGTTYELSTANGTCTACIYVGTDIWRRTTLSPW